MPPLVRDCLLVWSQIVDEQILNRSDDFFRSRLSCATFEIRILLRADVEMLQRQLEGERRALREPERLKFYAAAWCRVRVGGPVGACHRSARRSVIGHCNVTGALAPMAAAMAADWRQWPPPGLEMPGRLGARLLTEEVMAMAYN